jgi:AraC family transcriptional regulator
MLEIPGMRFSITSVRNSGLGEVEILKPWHVLSCDLSGQRDEMVDASWDGRMRTRGHVSRADVALLVPAGGRFIARRNGDVSYRSFVAELDQSSVARVLGDGYGASELSSQFDVNQIAPGLAERFEAVCLAQTSYPLAYVEALAAILVIELFRVYGTKPLALKPPEHIGTSRLTPIVDYIEEHLDHDISLAELASLAHLSVAQFARAFKAACGTAPYRYIIQRRIERAKILLRTSDQTIASIAASVGFPSQSRFSSSFAQVTGATPSVFRSADT